MISRFFFTVFFALICVLFSFFPGSPCFSCLLPADSVFADVKGQAQQKTVTHRTTEIHGTAEIQRRIVTLSPHLTEIVFALGSGDELVGTVEQSDFPAAALMVPRVGSFVAPDVERILKLSATTVLATEGNRKDSLEFLKKRNVPVKELNVDRAAQLPTHIKEVAGLLGKEKEGAALALKIETSLQKLKVFGKAKSESSGARSFLFILQLNPLMSLSNKTWLGDLLRMAGIENVVGDSVTAYPMVSFEAVRSKKVELIFTDFTMHGKNAEIAKLLGGKIKNIELPQDVFYRPGPRITEAVQFLIDNL